MARPMHRHRMIRLSSTRSINKQNRVDNAPRKRAERARRDERIIAKIKAAKGKDYSPEVKSWITARAGKQWRQITDKDIQAAISE